MSISIAAIPQNPVLQTGNGQNLLSWSIVAGASTYSVQRSTDGVSWTIISTPATNYYVDATALIGVSYFYQVASVSTAGTSAYAASFPPSITPCLPGQINLGYLRYMAQLKADKLYSEYLTTDEWNFNLNQSANELYDILITKFGDQYFLALPVQFNANGTAVYSLPDGSNYSNAPALYKLAGVDVGVDPSNQQWFTLPRFNWIDRNRYATLQLSGTVQSIYGLAYCPWGNNLYFIPNPQAANVFQLWYVPVLTQMLLDTDMMPFSISGWSEYVIVDAAMKAMQKEESMEKWASLAQSKAALLERIETTAANRDVGQSNTISNTRARCGDPNFGSFGGFGTSGFGNGFGWGG